MRWKWRNKQRKKKWKHWFTEDEDGDGDGDADADEERNGETAAREKLKEEEATYKIGIRVSESPRAGFLCRSTTLSYGGD